MKISSRLERIETNSQFAQIISPSDTVAIITLNIKIGDVEGLMNICLPFDTLEPVIDKLNTKYWFSTMKRKILSLMRRQLVIQSAQLEFLLKQFSEIA